MLGIVEPAHQVQIRLRPRPNGYDVHSLSGHDTHRNGSTEADARPYRRGVWNPVGMSFRLATWNIWGDGQPWHYTRDRGEVRGAVPGSSAAIAPPTEGVWSHRRSLILAVLRSSQPDIVALQEADRDLGRSDELASALRWNATAPTAGGLAVISRHRFGSSTTVRLTDRADGYGADEALHAVVAHPGGDLDILVVHLTPRSSRFRVEAARALAEYLDRLPTRPLAVLGDFNTVDAQMPELEVLQRAGLRDASLISGCTAGATMPSHDPIVRLDYIFLGRGLIATDSRRIGSEPDTDGFYPSDHLGLLADVHIA